LRPRSGRIALYGEDTLAGLRFTFLLEGESSSLIGLMEFLAWLKGLAGLFIAEARYTSSLHASSHCKMYDAQAANHCQHEGQDHRAKKRGSWASGTAWPTLTLYYRTHVLMGTWQEHRTLMYKRSIQSKSHFASHHETGASSQNRGNCSYL
jgi:hypothetical protein